DFQWFDITESDDNLTAEVLTKFPGNLWFVKNDDELRFYSDEARTNYHGVYYNFMREDDGSINIWRGQNKWLVISD
ncbi:MAG: hypothetical protein IJT57_05050, partial [Selenomonadaceae bacterium]|nr:hypothetical protein [Selenomonadaceae bacterium]